jgi:hypothetical protein
MQFKTVFATVLGAAAPLMAAAQAGFCPEAARFGVVTVTPTTFAPGDVSAFLHTGAVSDVDN